MPENKTAIIIGCDHAAYGLKEKVKAYLLAEGFPVEDAGAYGESSVDYPDVAIKVAGKVSSGQFTRGMLMCGTGIGMSMVANRFPYVRAALCNDLFAAIMSRRHNDANILAMGGRVIGEALALEVVKAFLQTPFEGGRHLLRLKKFNRPDDVAGSCAAP